MRRFRCRRPRPPEGVRLVLCTGDTIELSTRYLGRWDGQDEWQAFSPLHPSEFDHLHIDLLHAQSSLSLVWAASEP